MFVSCNAILICSVFAFLANSISKTTLVQRSPGTPRTGRGMVPDGRGSYHHRIATTPPFRGFGQDIGIRRGRLPGSSSACDCLRRVQKAIAATTLCPATARRAHQSAASGTTKRASRNLLLVANERTSPMVFEVWMQTSVDIIFASISIQRGCAKAAAFVIICTKLKKNRVLIFFLNNLLYSL